MSESLNGCIYESMNLRVYKYCMYMYMYMYMYTYMYVKVCVRMYIMHMYANRGGPCLLPEMFGPMGHEHIHCHAYINIYSTYSYWYGYTLVYACHAVLASTYNS